MPAKQQKKLLVANRQPPRPPSSNDRSQAKQGEEVKDIKCLPSPVEVSWLPPKPTKAGKCGDGHMQGRPRKIVRERSEVNTKRALEKENRFNPPENGEGQWVAAQIRHGYEVNSNGLSRHGQRGDSKPHVNASAKSNQGTEETVYIDWNGNVEPKVPRKREPRLRYEVNKDGDTFVRRTGH
ncbi:hypothetical protein PENSTE_c021G07381 [Penicillium steckii]|uniref:Uncharacterized protein n=1 Tax=Penicillium steckii TaxID=303698 RepID=A0A1V6STA8_9EURO|nr:hypothetical protein PENSTE_c021G07381 [Penicillium steckii]